MRRASRWAWLGLLPLLTGCREWEALQSWAARQWSPERRPTIDVIWITQNSSAWAWRQWSVFQNWLKRRLPDVPLRFHQTSTVETTLSPRLEVAARDLQLGDLPISELRWRWERPRLGLAFSRAGLDAFYDQRWPIEVTLAEVDLQGYMRKRMKELEQTRLSLHPNLLILETTVPFLGLQVPVKLESELAWRQGQQLILSQARAFVNGRPAPDEWLRPYLQRLDPLFDSQRDLNLPFPIEWEQVRIEEDQLRLTGGLRLRSPSQAPAPEGAQQPGS